MLNVMRLTGFDSSGLVVLTSMNESESAKLEVQVRELRQICHD